jgi:hypothetical protein
MREQLLRISFVLHYLAPLVCVVGSQGCTKNQVSGTAAVNERRVTLSHSISLWDADERTAAIVFFSSAPTAAERDKILKNKARSWALALDKKTPFVELALEFRPASVHAELATLAGYRVDFWNFRDDLARHGSHADSVGFGPLLDWTKQKEVIEVSGDLQRGGRLKGRLKGVREATKGGVNANNLPRCEWSLTFDVKLE